MADTIETFKVHSDISNKLEQLICSEQFPWYFNTNTVGNDIGRVSSENNFEGFQFVHGLYRDHVPQSGFFNDIVPVLTDIKEMQFEFFNRIKLNLNLRSHTEYVHLPVHVDTHNPKYTSMIYYVNDSDGDTLFFDNNNTIIERVTPEKGKVIFFKSNIPHAAQNPIKNEKRIIINFTGLRNV